MRPAPIRIRADVSASREPPQRKDLTIPMGCQLTPRLVPSAQAKNVAVVVVTGDRGLCGGYNAQMIKKAEARIVELQSQVRTGRGRVDCQGRAGAARGGQEGEARIEERGYREGEVPIAESCPSGLSPRLKRKALRWSPGPGPGSRLTPTLSPS